MVTEVKPRGRRIREKCSYEFRVGSSDRGDRQIVIDCSWPSGLRSRMCVEEPDWEAFAAGLRQAIGHASLETGDLAVTYS